MTMRMWAMAVVVGGMALGSARAETWERFGGPRGAGTVNGQKLPSPIDEKALVWKIAIPGLGNSSPIIWHDRVFIQTATPEGDKRSLLCLDVKTGKTIWEREFTGKKAHTHQKNTLASSSPACDGESVYVALWDGVDVVLHALTMAKGEPMWNKNLGEFKSQHGPGASPIVHKDKVYYGFDMDGKAKFYAFDKKTGKESWTAGREAFRACYTAPQILEKGPTGEELLVTSTTAITSYNPDTGSQNWNWTWTWPPKTKPLRTIAASVETAGMLFAFSGDGGGDRLMVALKLPDVVGAKPVQAWENRKDFPYVPCVLAHGKNLHFVNDRGFAGCFDMKSGKKVYLERVPEATFTASPILVDGKLYAGSEEGDLIVIAATEKFDIVSRMRLGERIRATPAVADGRLFVRGAASLYCFGKKD